MKNIFLMLALCASTVFAAQPENNPGNSGYETGCNNGNGVGVCPDKGPAAHPVVPVRSSSDIDIQQTSAINKLDSQMSSVNNVDSQMSSVNNVDSQITINSTNPTSQHIRYSGKVETTPDVVAPALATGGIDTCMGSSSIGGAGPGIGISIGSTWTDENCVRLKVAREMANLGFRDVAVAMHCNNAEVRAAMKSVGRSDCDHLVPINLEPNVSH